MKCFHDFKQVQVNLNFIFLFIKHCIPLPSFGIVMEKQRSHLIVSNYIQVHVAISLYKQ